ncbi:MAG: sterol desaturase family protein [Polyangiaceae bacterium]|nr:sterol desaturase family protein [Polyangiaceae bacterium]MCW5792143.1 sterol desaturase family protein [Polyangiaceae bacterium]
MSQMHFILFAIPAFFATMLLEYLIVRRRRVGKGYAGRDTAASLTMGVGNLAISFSVKAVSFGLYVWVYQYRLLDIPLTGWWVLPALLIAEDFLYYWFHRAHHEVRVLWAAHVNHHSSTHYNLSTALRQSWTTPITGPVFWMPLALVGFHPSLVLVAQAISLLYQYWIHTEAIGRLGPLEWVLNTPSHHRVHHGRNPEYLDRNYGGILIIWDRLFGTFEPERAPVDYGLTKNISTYNPVRIAFHEWFAVLRDAARAGSVRHAIGFLLRPPGWLPNGAGATAADLRAAAERESSQREVPPPMVRASAEPSLAAREQVDGV